MRDDDFKYHRGSDNMITMQKNLVGLQTLTGIETFCGAGGMSLGLLRAGIDVRLAFDLNAKAVETYNRNIADHCHVMDARKVTGRQLLELAGLSKVDVISGGPPCQGFSKQKRGAHLLQDRRNSLVLDYARIVDETKARAFIFENVAIFGQKRGGDLIEEVRQRLDNYWIYTYFVSSSDFGLAQKRGRFLMIGIDRSESDIIPVLEVTNKVRTVRDAIGDLPAPPADYTEHPRYPNHMKCRITKLNEKRFSFVPPGGGWQDIPKLLQLPCHRNADITSGGWPDVYGRLSWDGQCPTLTAGFDSFTRGRYGHPEQNRALTLREGARLQGFPDDFRFYGTRRDVRLQIGNAVPPPVAEAAGEAVSRVLRGIEQRPLLYQMPEETLMEITQLSLAM